MLRWANGRETPTHAGNARHLLGDLSKKHVQIIRYRSGNDHIGLPAGLPQAYDQQQEPVTCPIWNYQGEHPFIWTVNLEHFRAITKVPDTHQPDYSAEELASTYELSIQQAQRTISRFGSGRRDLDRLLGCEARSPDHRQEEEELTTAQIAFGLSG
jgi:hypothetical protein